MGNAIFIQFQCTEYGPCSTGQGGAERVKVHRKMLCHGSDMRICAGFALTFGIGEIQMGRLKSREESQLKS